MHYLYEVVASVAEGEIWRGDFHAPRSKRIMSYLKIQSDDTDSIIKDGALKTDSVKIEILMNAVAFAVRRDISILSLERKGTRQTIRKVNPIRIVTAFAILCASAQAQITSIQTISSSRGLGPVTTIAPLGNGYSYATVGGPHGGSWGIVQVSPGSQLSMGVTPRGGILPIVTPQSYLPGNQQTEALSDNMDLIAAAASMGLLNRSMQSEVKPLPKPKDLEAWHAFLKSNGIGPKSTTSVETYNDLVKAFNDLQKLKLTSSVNSLAGEIPAPKGSDISARYAWLHNQLDAQSMKQFSEDWRKDSELGKDDKADTHALHAYLKVWIKSHPGCLTGHVANGSTNN
jgi:hypothetical protein